MCVDGKFPKVHAVTISMHDHEIKAAILLSYVVNLQNFRYIMSDSINHKSFYLKSFVIYSTKIFKITHVHSYNYPYVINLSLVPHVHMLTLHNYPVAI